MRSLLPLAILLLLTPALLFSQTAGSTTGTGSTSTPPADSAGTAPTSTDTSGTTASADTGSTAGSTASGSTSGGTAATNAGQAAKNEPVPYSPTEFPTWVNDLRRAEIITIGAFPISLLVTSLTYQLYRYVQNGFSQAYAPALLGSGANPLSNQERIGVIISGIGVSMVIALVDYGLGKVKK